nr:phospholipase A1-Igamma1, chloroplastic [Tanacetum cinerariifolium]
MAVNVKPVNHHYRYQPLPTTVNHRNRITASFNEFTINEEFKNSIKSSRLAKSITQLMNTYIEKQQSLIKKDLFQSDNQNAVALSNSLLEKPVSSPKKNISKIWREIHGENYWEGVLDPLDENVRREILKYGEFAQASYDSFDFDSFSEYCGSCLFSKKKFFEKLGLEKHGYDVSRYIYAMSQYEIPRWLEKSYVAEEDTWSKDSNWMGFVCVSGDIESERIGRRDVVVALDWVYHHVGAELKLDVRASPFLKRGSNFIGIHHPETYLHLVDGYVSSTAGFRPDAKRDVALVNKYCDMLVNELRIPPCWYQLSNKGLVSNEFGRMVRPKRDPEDIPSPIEEENSDF